jgi:hypothetical protein
VVADQVVTEAGGHHPLAQRHADRRAQALTERARRRLDAWRVLALGVAGGGRADLAELLDLVERQRIPGQVQHRVEEHRRVPRREDEAVAGRPVRVGRVVTHHARVEHVGERSQPHRRARMP